METASEKRKRGRPSVFMRSFGDESFAAELKESIRGKSARSLANALYYSEGLVIAQEVCDVDQVFSRNGRDRGNCVLEQIGRMSLQNGYSQDDCKQVCKLAVRALNEGCTVRQVEAYIRRGRNCGEW